jgi:hypothetical protein
MAHKCITQNCAAHYCAILQAEYGEEQLEASETYAFLPSVSAQG